MTNSRKTARIHLLPAKESPYCVLLRRKPSKWVHVMRWDTATDEIEHGSWFNGRIHELHCDLSWDGEWLFYFASGSKGLESWRAVCRPPRLTVAKWWEGSGTWGGGAYWRTPNTLVTDFGMNVHAGGGWLRRLIYGDEEPDFGVDEQALPFRLQKAPWNFSSDEPVATLLGRLERDGWERLPSKKDWESQPSPQHPKLRLTYLGDKQGYKFGFGLEGHQEVVADADWACWSNQGDLLVSKRGVVRRYSMSGLAKGKPDAELDLESLEVPPERLNYRPPAEGVRE